MFRIVRRVWPPGNSTLEALFTTGCMAIIAYGLFRLSEIAY